MNRWAPAFVPATALLCASCGPRLTDAPTEFVGDRHGRVATLCGAQEMKAGDDGDFWVKFLTQHDPEWSVDWSDGKLTLAGGSVKRKALGRPTRQEDGMWARFETYWVRANPDRKAGDTITVGPLTHVISKKGQGTRRVESAYCVVVVKD